MSRLYDFDLIVERRIVGSQIRDVVSGNTGFVAARAWVSATGIWCDELRERDDASASPLVKPSKGVNLVVPRSRLRNECAVILASAQDRRAVFLIPWGERTIIGTTDTYYSGNVNRPKAETEDVDYLLRLVHSYLPDVRISRRDILSTYAGLRPLLQDDSGHPSRAPRDHALLRSRSGLLTITGGKLTTYRLMARDVVNRIVRQIGQREIRSTTHKLDLFATPPSQDPLVKNYGSEAAKVRSMAQRNGLNRPMVDGLPHILAEGAYALQHERAVHLADILSRRTRLILFAEGQARREAESIAKALAPLAGWNPTEELERYEVELSFHASGG